MLHVVGCSVVFGGVVGCWDRLWISGGGGGGGSLQVGKPKMLHECDEVTKTLVISVSDQ